MNSQCCECGVCMCCMSTCGWHPLNHVLQAAQRIYKLLFAYEFARSKKNDNRIYTQFTLTVLFQLCASMNGKERLDHCPLCVRMRCKPINEQWHNFCCQMTLTNISRMKRKKNARKHTHIHIVKPNERKKYKQP